MSPSAARLSCQTERYEPALNKKTRGFPSLSHDGFGFDEMVLIIV
jgi:hypothetical protein